MSKMPASSIQLMQIFQLVTNVSVEVLLNPPSWCNSSMAGLRFCRAQQSRSSSKHNMPNMLLFAWPGNPALRIRLQLKCRSVCVSFYSLDSPRHHWRQF